MKLRYKILIGIGLFLVAGFGLLVYMNRPITKAEAKAEIQSELNNVAAKEGITSTVMTVYSDTKDIHFELSAGTTSDGNGGMVEVEPNHLYHSASVGKTMTATVIGMLHEEGVLNYQEKIADYLAPELLEGVFVYEGVDYSGDVTIEHLLEHTSGVADFFEGSVVSGKTMLQEIAEDPDRWWAAEELIAFTRGRQTAVGKPGDVMNYSDTGYTLAGLIVETVTGKPFVEVVTEKIFEPLGMDQSFYTLRTEAHVPSELPMLEMWIDGVDYSDKNILSLDWAGGGVAATPEDLLTFMKALHNGELVGEAYLNRMKTFQHDYLPGVKYGMGMMLFDMSEFSPMLGHMPDIYGGVGATATYMMYNERDDIYIIANIGSMNHMEDGVMALINTMLILDRISE